MDEVFDGIFIGDSNDASTCESGRFDAVVTLSNETVDATTHVKHIDDGKNEQADFNEAVEVTRDAFKNNETVLVHCSAGQSRSVTLVATVLAEKRNHPFDKIVAEIRSQRPKASPTYFMKQHAYTYLGEPTTSLDELFED